MQKNLKKDWKICRQSSFATEPIAPSPYIENNFYEEYLERLIEKVNKQYRKKTISLLRDAYDDYQYSIEKNKSFSIKEQMSNFLANENISLSDKYNIIDLISKNYINLTEEILKNLIAFAIENEDMQLFQLINLYCNIPPGKLILNNYLSQIKNKEDIKVKIFFSKVENAKNIDDLINTSLAETNFNENSINVFLKKLEELSIVETRSKNDEKDKYVNSFEEFIKARLKKEKKKDLLSFYNWQLTEKNLKNQYSLIPGMSAIIFEEFIEKDTTINWILQTENLLNTTIIEFFASEKVPLEKKIKFLMLDNTKKNIINCNEYYSRLDAALLELTSSEEGQKIYLKIITDKNAAKISSTILALVYGFFNYTEQEGIKNNTGPILNNFKTMNCAQKHFVLNYGDKKFIEFLETEKKTSRTKSR
jgi:hypothetical protein